MGYILRGIGRNGNTQARETQTFEFNLRPWIERW